MHKAFFGIKRVHLRVLAVSRALLGGVALTPARFDLMRVVEIHTEGIPQRNIQYLLGVSAPTISRMVKALEKQGMLRRARWERDRRCWLVELTEVGRAVVGSAREQLIDTGVAERFALRGLGRDPETARPDLTTLQRFLTRMRRAFNDWSPFEHPWRVGCIEEPYAYHDIVDGRLKLVTAPT
jgi:DNA-binding MarR family transcriptional regulator